jgi:quercetin 2,3-dioxygenase
MLEVRRSRDRGYTDHGWLKTYYTFSFQDYYDPEHVDFGPLKVMNEDRVKPGKGYPTQEYRDVEVLTYLIEGELAHKDSLGNETRLLAGGLQCLSAGRGATHSELNSSASLDAHLLYICMGPTKPGMSPAYGQKHFPPEEKRGHLRLIASSDGEDDSLLIHQDARLYTGTFHESEKADLDLGKNRRAFLHVKITPPGDFILQHGREADILIFDVPLGIAPPARKTSTPKPRKAKKAIET